MNSAYMTPLAWLRDVLFMLLQTTCKGYWREVPLTSYHISSLMGISEAAKRQSASLSPMACCFALFLFLWYWFSLLEKPARWLLTLLFHVDFWQQIWHLSRYTQMYAIGHSWTKMSLSTLAVSFKDDLKRPDWGRCEFCNYTKPGVFRICSAQQ